MRKSKIQFSKSLKERLLLLPTIVDHLERKEYTFIDKFLAWIRETEQFLSDNNIADTAKFSGFRALMTSKRYDSNIKSYKKEQMKLGGESLIEIQDIIQQILQPIDIKIEECRALIKQILTIISQSNLVVYNPKLNFETFINQVWISIQTSDQIKGGSVKLKSILNNTDIILLLAEEINLEDFSIENLTKLKSK